MTSLPPLPTNVVGSYSMPAWLERAKNDFLQRKVSRHDLDEMYDSARKAAVKDQEVAGIDIISGDARYTGGIPEMLDGVDFLPVAIGLFGMGEVLAGAEQTTDQKILQARYGLRDVMLSAADWARSRWAIARGTVLGFFVGILPGAGSTIASFFAYSFEKRISRHPQEFGRGAIEGVQRRGYPFDLSWTGPWWLDARSLPHVPILIVLPVTVALLGVVYWVLSRLWEPMGRAQRGA